MIAKCSSPPKKKKKGALGRLARKTYHAPQTNAKPKRLELISRLKAVDPLLNMSAACGALDVSRSSYCDWMAAPPAHQHRKADGKPKVAYNVVAKDLTRGRPLEVPTTDMTYRRAKSAHQPFEWIKTNIPSEISQRCYPME